MSDPVGEAFVRIRPDASGFREDAQQQVDAAVSNIKATAEVRVDQNVTQRTRSEIAQTTTDRQVTEFVNRDLSPGFADRAAAFSEATQDLIDRTEELNQSAAALQGTLDAVSQAQQGAATGTAQTTQATQDAITATREAAAASGDRTRALSDEEKAARDAAQAIARIPELDLSGMRARMQEQLQSFQPTFESPEIQARFAAAAPSTAFEAATFASIRRTQELNEKNLVLAETLGLVQRAHDAAAASTEKAAAASTGAARALSAEEQAALRLQAGQLFDRPENARTFVGAGPEPVFDTRGADRTAEIQRRRDEIAAQFTTPIAIPVEPKVEQDALKRETEAAIDKLVASGTLTDIPFRPEWDTKEFQQQARDEIAKAFEIIQRPAPVKPVLPPLGADPADFAIFNRQSDDYIRALEERRDAQRLVTASQNVLTRETDRGAVGLDRSARAADRDARAQRGRNHMIAEALGFPYARLGIIGIAAVTGHQALQELSRSLAVTGEKAGTTTGRLRNMASELVNLNVIGAVKALTSDLKLTDAEVMAIVGSTREFKIEQQAVRANNQTLLAQFRAMREQAGQIHLERLQVQATLTPTLADDIDVQVKRVQEAKRLLDELVTPTEHAARVAAQRRAGREFVGEAGVRGNVPEDVRRTIEAAQAPVASKADIEKRRGAIDAATAALQQARAAAERQRVTRAAVRAQNEALAVAIQTDSEAEQRHSAAEIRALRRASENRNLTADARAQFKNQLLAAIAANQALDRERSRASADLTASMRESAIQSRITIAGINGADAASDRATEELIAFYKREAARQERIAAAAKDAAERQQAAAAAAANAQKAAQTQAQLIITQQSRQFTLEDQAASRAQIAAGLTQSIADDNKADRDQIAQLRERLATAKLSATQKSEIRTQIAQLEAGISQREQQAAAAAEQARRAAEDARISARRAAAERTRTNLADDAAVDRLELAALRRRLADATTAAAERIAIQARIAQIAVDAAERERQLRLLRRDRARQIEDLRIERRKTLAQLTESTADDEAALRAEITLWRKRATAAKKSGDLVALETIRNHIADVRVALANLKKENSQLQTDAFSIFKEMQRTFTQFAPNVQLGDTGNLTGVLGRSGAPTTTQQGAAPGGAPVNVTINQSFPEPTPNRMREIQYASFAAKAFFDSGF